MMRPGKWRQAAAQAIYQGYPDQDLLPVLTVLRKNRRTILREENRPDPTAFVASQVGNRPVSAKPRFRIKPRRIGVHCRTRKLRHDNTGGGVVDRPGRQELPGIRPPASHFP